MTSHLRTITSGTLDWRGILIHITLERRRWVDHLQIDTLEPARAAAAADHGSFYRAARAMSVEQSTLSRKILKLEHAIGAKIFSRSRAGVKTTFMGDQFIRSARLMVASADKMVTFMRAAGQGRAG